MKSIQPPALATWLLRQFGSSPRNEAILGDLAEQYAHGRSRLWYWRESLTAISVSASRGIWQNKGPAILALCTGWIILVAGQPIVDHALQTMTEINAGGSLAQYV